MKKTIFVLPATVPAGTEIILQAQNSGRHVLGAVFADSAINTEDQPETRDASIIWNPESFASSRAAIIEAERAFGSPISEIVLVADFPESQVYLNRSSPAELEQAISFWITGYAHMAREAINAISSRSHGVFTVLIQARETGDLLANMGMAAMEGLANALLAQSSQGMFGSCRFLAIKDESENTEGMARSLLKHLDNPPKFNGKIIRQGGKAFLFK